MQKNRHRKTCMSLLLSAMYIQGSAYAQEQVKDTLAEVEVKAGAEKETARTEVRGYVANRATTATKTDTSILETPQSISVITADQIEDQKAQSVQEILRYSAGVVADQYGLDSRSDSYSIRGNAATQYINGLRGLNNYYTETTRPDPYNLERVEILRGPSSMLYGAGGVGGIVNLVSKRPQPIAKREVGISLGNFNRKQINADMTGPLNEDGTLLYRVVTLARETDTQVDYADDQRILFAPSLTWRPNDRTNLTVLAQYQLNDGRSTPQFLPWSGVLRPNPNGRINYDTYLSDPDFDRYKTQSAHLGWSFEHILNDTWTFRQNFRYTSSRNKYSSLYPNSFTGGANPFIDPNQRIINRYVDASRSDAKTINVDNNAQAKFVTGFAEHTLLMGLDYSRFRQGISGFADAGLGNPIDVYAPVYNPVDFSGVGAYQLPMSRQYQTGVYIQDQIKVGPWIATIGLRRDEAKRQADGSDAQVDRKTTGRYALTYLFDNGVAPYVSYAESFQPVQGTDKNGNLFSPQEGEQWELGLKYQPVGSRSRYTAAIYDMRDTNRLTVDPTSVFFSVQKGEVRSRGLELEALMSFENRLDMIAAYSYTNAKYSQTNNAAEKGEQVETIPRHLASVWGIKRFSVGNMDGFRAGLGARYIGSSHDSTGVLETPDVTLVDAMLGLDHGSWRYALNASNLFDKEYVSTCISRGDCWLGTRRTAIASATYYW
jgi:iron complex outermembrane receptor protein